MMKLIKKYNYSDEEELFHNNWAKNIKLDELCVMQAFEGPVSPEYHQAIRLLGSLKNKKILNPGCGAGEEAVYLAKKGAKVVAIDISSEMLRVAKRLAIKFKVNEKIQFRKMNAEELSFRKDSFDLVFGNSVLHHIKIKKSLVGFQRVLKKGGKAVFIEPLFYNPIINLYRKMAKQVRTRQEHPLKNRDIKEFMRIFRSVRHYEYQFATLLVFCYFFVFERVSPNKDRYWKKIIREGKRFKKLFNFLFFIDNWLLYIFPPIRWLCWSTVIAAEK